MKTLIDSVFGTAADPSRVEVLFYVDGDDPSLAGYAALRSPAPGFARMFTGIPILGSQSINKLVAPAYGQILVTTNDDVVYRTKKWDSLLLSAAAVYPDGIFCAYFNDGIGGEKLSTFPMTSRRWFDTLGYLVPPQFTFLYWDNWFMDVASKLGRLMYIGSVLAEHMHVSRMKSRPDDTYNRNMMHPLRRADLDNYRATKRAQRTVVELLRGAMK